MHFLYNFTDLLNDGRGQEAISPTRRVPSRVTSSVRYPKAILTTIDRLVRFKFGASRFFSSRPVHV